MFYKHLLVLFICWYLLPVATLYGADNLFLGSVYCFSINTVSTGRQFFLTLTLPLVGICHVFVRELLLVISF